jgi:hypothetical protein
MRDDFRPHDRLSGFGNGPVNSLVNFLGFARYRALTEKHQSFRIRCVA